MKKKIYIQVVRFCRLLMGGIFFFMGINGFIEIVAMPEHSEKANAFLQALGQTQYFWPLEKFLETITGVMLLSRRFVPLAVDMLAAIIVNIVLFHIFLDVKGLGIALVVLTCELVLFTYLWPNHFRDMFSPKSDVP